MIGNIGGSLQAEPASGSSQALGSLVNLRSIAAGNRQDFVEFMRAVKENKMKPLIDPIRFDMDNAKEAYKYMVCHLNFVIIMVGVFCIYLCDDFVISQSEARITKPNSLPGQ